MSFAEFVEEKQVVQLLQRSLGNGRLAHAYLLTGTALDELERMARTLAKTLNCSQPPQRGTSGLPLDSCDHCLSCRKIEGDNHPDVHWVRPESKSRVIIIEQVRELMQAVYLKPAEAQFKAAVIVAADRFNVQAANAFLKTLEEPPDRSILLLLSTEPQRILETILSRCMRLNFSSEGKLGAFEIYGDWLGQFCDMAATEPKGLLNRYRLLSVLLTRLTQIKADTQKNQIQRSPLERHEDIEPHLKEKWEEELAAAIEAEYRRQRSELLLGLQWWFRDVWLQTFAASQNLIAFPTLAKATQAVAQRITPAAAIENLTILDRTQRLLGSNVQEALALEVSILKLRL
jgi:DNA polymerase-3 subunit delta'